MQGPLRPLAGLGSPREPVSSLLWDLDDDGDLDIVTNDFNAEPLVLISDLAQKHPVRYLKVQLVGTASPRDAIGTSVNLHAGDQSFRKVHDGNSGYLSFSSMPLYFGLGDQETIDSIEIRWPSGNEQSLAGPFETNKLLVLTEP